MKRKISIDGSPTFMKFFRSLDEESRQYKEINDNLDLLKLDPVIGDRIRKELWPKSYIKKYGIHTLFRMELNGGWRLIYTISGNKKNIMCTILEIFDHKEYEKKFNY